MPHGFDLSCKTTRCGPVGPSPSRDALRLARLARCLRPSWPGLRAYDGLAHASLPLREPLAGSRAVPALPWCATTRLDPKPHRGCSSALRRTRPPSCPRAASGLGRSAPGAHLFCGTRTRGLPRLCSAGETLVSLTLRTKAAFWARCRLPASGLLNVGLSSSLPRYT
jgi:hypothetical protein